MSRMLACAVIALTSGPALAAAPSYAFAPNAPLAHVYRDGVVADAGSPGFVKYIRGNKSRGWKLEAREDGRPVAFIPGVQANLWLPVGPELVGRPLVLEAVFKPLGPDQRMDPFVGKTKLRNLTLKPGWQAMRVPVPAELVKANLLRVRLHFRRSVAHAGVKTAAALRYVRLVPADAPPGPVDEASIAAALKVTDGDAVRLPDGGGLDFYVVPPKGMRVQGDATGGTVEVWAQLDGKAPRKLGEGARLDVPLDRVAGRPVRLMLRGKGGAVRLRNGGLGGGTLGAAGGPRPKHVVFWLIDTLRADKLTFYKDLPNPHHRKVKTPNLAAFAKEATVFDPFYIQGNESKASHASLFTGTYPVVHRVFTQAAKLPDALLTIAEAFKVAGYRTAGFVSNGYISDRWNFDQGFREFENFIRENKANSAKAVVKKAKPWITKHKDEPFYLYLGTSDPHVSYHAHKDFIGDYDDGYTGRYKKRVSGAELGKIKGRKRPPSERDQRRIEALYENEVAFNDYYFGELIKHLKAEGIYDETLIIVGSDHGDEFWEHGSCGHGHSIHQELVRVPLIIRYPPVFPAKVVRSGAEGVDLLPTLQGLLGVKPTDGVQGFDLLPYVRGKGALYPNAVMASQGTGSYALQVGAAKAILRSELSLQIYDMKADPSEQEDLSGGGRPVLTLAALDPLSLFVANAKAWRKSRWGAPNNLRAPIR